MPIHEFKCENGHITEKLFLTFAQADVEKNNPIRCAWCGAESLLSEFSVPRPAHLLGNPDGYHKPSPTKRYSTKLVSQKDGNKNSIS